MDSSVRHDALRLVRLVLVGIASAAGLLVLSAILSMTSASAAGPERSGLLDGVDDAVSGTVDAVGSTVSDATATTTNTVEKAVEKVVVPAAAAVPKTAEPVVQAVKPAVPAPVQPVVEAVVPVVSGATEAVTETVDETAAAVTEAAPTPVSTVATPVTEAADEVLGSVPFVSGITGPSPLTEATDGVVDAVDGLVIGDVVGSIRDVVGTIGAIGDAAVGVVAETPRSVVPLLPSIPGLPAGQGGLLGSTGSLALLAAGIAVVGGGALTSARERAAFRAVTSGGSIGHPSASGPPERPLITTTPLPGGSPAPSPLGDATAGSAAAPGTLVGDTSARVVAPSAASRLSTLPSDEAVPSSLSARTLPSPD